MQLNKDHYILIIIFLASFLFSLFVCNFDFIEASDFIVFLSITIGYQITTVAALYNSKILSVLYKTDDHGYPTKLHRLACYYKYSIYFGIFFIFILIFINKDASIIFNISDNKVTINKSSFFLPMFLSIIYWFLKANRVFFKIFILPRNE